MSLRLGLVSIRVFPFYFVFSYPAGISCIGVFLFTALGGHPYALFSDYFSSRFFSDSSVFSSLRRGIRLCCIF